MNAIVNESSITDVALYQVPDIDTDLVFDFVGSQDLTVVEEGIRRISSGMDVLDLVQGIEIIRIEREGLWRQGDFPNLRAYRIAQSERLGMPSSTITARRRSAEAWIDHRKDLRKIPLQGNVAKLRYFNQAMEAHDSKQEVLKHFKEDSIREFIAFARPVKKTSLPEVDASVEDDVLSIDGRAICRFAKAMPEGEREFILYHLRKVYSMRKGGLLPYPVAVYSISEGHAVDRLLAKYRSGK